MSVITSQLKKREIGSAGDRKKSLKESRQRERKEWEQSAQGVVQHCDGVQLEKVELREVSLVVLCSREYCREQTSMRFTTTEAISI